jgi:ribosomal protein S18 acetylase RimI-like enzyme
LNEEEKKVVGSCIAWQDKRGESVVSSLQWLIVDEKYRGLGLGKALCYTVMNIFNGQGKFPVYIHTQPWSWKAVFLYLSIGFKLQKNDTFSHYKNEYKKAMTELKKIVTDKQFELLQELSEE